MGDRVLLALGQLADSEQQVLASAASAVGLTFKLVHQAAEAMQTIEADAPLALLVDVTCAGTERLCALVRSKEAFSGMPIMGFGRRLTPMNFNQIFVLGADDLVSVSEPGPLTERVRMLAAAGSGSPVRLPSHGRALVVDADFSRAAILKRSLTKFGFEVKSVADERTAYPIAKRDRTTLVIWALDGDPPVPFMERCRREGSQAAWVLSAATERVEEFAQAVLGQARVRVTSSSGSPENLIHLAHRLLDPDHHPGSPESRLYGAVVAFRPATDAGQGRLDFGFTHLVGKSTLSVRTMLPCADERIWIELVPPRRTRPVQLLARVAERRTFGSSLTALPPGMDLEIIGGIGSSAAIWRQACAELLDAAGARAELNERIGLGPLEVPTDSEPEASTLPRLTRADLAQVAALEAAAQAKPLGLELPVPGQSVLPPALQRPQGFEWASTLVRCVDRCSDAWDALGESLSALTARVRNRGAPAFQLTPETTPNEALEVPVAGAGRVGSQGRLFSNKRRALVWALASGCALVAIFALLLPGSSAAPSAAGASLPAPLAIEPGHEVSADANSVSPPSSESAREQPAQSDAPIKQAVQNAARPSAQELAALPAQRGYLFVKSNRKARVYLHGIDVGQTNEPLITPCGTRFVRLGTGPGEFLEPGRPTVIGCQAYTELDISVR